MSRLHSPLHNQPSSSDLQFRQNKLLQYYYNQITEAIFHVTVNGRRQYVCFGYSENKTRFQSWPYAISIPIGGQEENEDRLLLIFVPRIWCNNVTKQEDHKYN